ncbi:hypothetical protein DXT99_18640 [Pontibacter diazotrophicus]|uniref:DUF1440 domain-containing protein n=1 Tax=Pontibacter diazotrophicus TaxID=1400979 RepID=A0A3D8L835_9BACT|nr:hypothetical protein [Pontibacter diazotrophicus]RDV13558.1 hypothetical protein DXT99_18640 [Pontibacter diazotrophicus]
MSNKSDFFAVLAKGGGILGKGLIAGFAGTAAITISQMIEMSITKRSMSDAPAKVGGKALGVEPRGKAELEKEKAASDKDEASDELKEEVESNKEQFEQLMHFGYGTGWGVARSALDLADIRGVRASAIHFGAIWGTAQIMLPANNAAKPITEWSAKQIAIDLFHHAVYAFAAGAVYDAMKEAEPNKKKKKKKKDKKKKKKGKK